MPSYHVSSEGKGWALTILNIALAGIFFASSLAMCLVSRTASPQSTGNVQEGNEQPVDQASLGYHHSLILLMFLFSFSPHTSAPVARVLYPTVVVRFPLLAVYRNADGFLNGRFLRLNGDVHHYY